MGNFLNLGSCQLRDIKNLPGIRHGTGDGGGAGTGDGDGAGTGDGGGAGNPDKIACQNACKTKYPAAVDKWTAYNTCVTKTCATSCL